MAPRIPSRLTLHGVTLADSYAWMRDPASPALARYLTAERAYYDAQSSHLAGLISDLYNEAAGRTPDQADDSPGWPAAGITYRTRIPAGQQNRQFLPRSRAGPGGSAGDPAEQLLLDENILAAGTGYVDVGVRQPSPDETGCSPGQRTPPGPRSTLRIRDTATGQDLPEIIERTYPGSAWSADSRQLFYLVPDELNRPYQVWRHRIGTDASADVLVLAEPDARFELTLHASRSGRIVVITAASRDTTRCM